MLQKTLLDEGLSLIVIDENGRKFSSRKNGIKPLLDCLDSEEITLRGAQVADKVVGRAAALLFALSEIKSLYATVLSEKAIDILDSAGIDYAFGTLVPYIKNRDENGMCPIEQSVTDMADPTTARRVIEEALRRL